MNVWILCNENAGRALAGEELTRLVERQGHTVVGVAKQYDTRTRPPVPNIDLLAAAGGDGTVATAASVAAASAVPLAILPLGTANNVATSLGLTRDIPELIAGWTSARRVPYDLGRVRAGTLDWCVVEGVGGGLVPAGIARAESAPALRDEVDPADEVAQAVRIFRDALDDVKARSWTLTIDGVHITEALLLIEVLNIRSVGPNLVFGPAADPSDGYFDVVMAQERHRDELKTYLERRAKGDDIRLNLPTRRAREVQIAACSELHVDAKRVDTCELGPIAIAIEPMAITVLV